MNIDIQEIIKQQLNMFDFVALIEEEVRKEIRRFIQPQIDRLTTAKIDIMVTEEIEKYLSSEVKTDDGWGKRATYPTFEDMFKQYLKRHLQDNYKIQSQVDKIIKEKIAKLLKEKEKEIADTIIDNITNLKL